MSKPTVRALPPPQPVTRSDSVKYTAASIYNCEVGDKRRGQCVDIHIGTYRNRESAAAMIQELTTKYDYNAREFVIMNNRDDGNYLVVHKFRG